MKTIILSLVLILSIAFQTKGQLIDEKNISWNNDSIYSTVLLWHVNNIESIGNKAQYLNDTVIQVFKTWPITNHLPTHIGKRKIKLIDYSEMGFLAKSGRFEAIEIRPMYFHNNEINISVGDISIIPDKDSYYTLVLGGSIFTIEYNCKSLNFEIISIKH